MTKMQKQAGFTAVELLITLFVAAAFLIAAYGLFNLVIKDGGATRGESRAANVAYDYMRQYAASSTTIPCTETTPLTNAPLSVDGLSNVTITVAITCLPDAISSLSKVDVAITYNAPPQIVKYSTLVSSSGSSSTGDITNGLVAWWQLNGNANNSIGSPNGVIRNAVSTTNQAGASDMAYGFTYASNSIISTPSTFGLAAKNSTISCWIYNPSASNLGVFVHVGLSAGFAIGIGNTTTENAGNHLIMLFEGIRWIPTSTTISVGWHHVVMVIDASGTPTAYLDGVSTGAYAGAASSDPSGSNTNIGGIISTGLDAYTGSVDDVRLYNRALPLADILSLYSAGAK
jgi:Tfp pilus assembly protein PilE